MGQETRYENKCLPMASNTQSITGRLVAATISWTDCMHLLQLPDGDIETLLVGMSCYTTKFGDECSEFFPLCLGMSIFMGYGSMGYWWHK